MNKQLIIISGPTAIGKTKLSIDLAKYLNTEIISADSRQFFKELKIGSAPPNQEQLTTIKHHFIQHLSITKDYNVGLFEQDAIRRIKKLFLKYNKIIMVGGSGLYIDSITKGLDKFPNIDDEIKQKIQKLYDDKGLVYLQNKIREYDPKYFKEVDQKNPQRLMRALTIIKSTGKTFSSFRTSKTYKRNFNIKHIALNIEREILYNRINTRVEKMITDGLIDEVKDLIPHKKKNALQTVGYKELFKYFDQETSLSEAIEKIKQNTRQLAKRQITWFRRDPNIKYFFKENLEDIIAFIEES